MTISYLILSTFLLILSCNHPSADSNCRYTDFQKDIAIDFGGKEATDMVISPFEKNKVYVTFLNQQGVEEIDLLTNERKTFGRPYWKYNRASSPIFEDKLDSIIWIGGANLDLLKFDQKTDSVQTMPLRYVIRIAERKDRIYFVTYQGIHYYDKASKLFHKIEGMPVPFIERSQQLDEETLILDDGLTFNMKSDTWQNGLHIYDYHNEEKLLFGIKAEHNIAIVREGAKLLAVNASGIKESKLEFYDDVSKIVINPPYLWEYDYSPDELRYNAIHRYNIESSELNRYSFRLPQISHTIPVFQIIEDVVWITRPQQIYLVNGKDGRSQMYDLEGQGKLVKTLVDDCSVFLLFSDRMLVKEKSSFIESCPYFDHQQYQQELIDYHAYIDSTQIQKDTDETVVLEKLGLIKQKYINETHPEILAELTQLNQGAFNNVRYETETEQEQCFLNTSLPREMRISCIGRLIRTIAHQGNWERVISYGAIARTLIKKEDPEYNYYYILSGVDSIEQYLSISDSLNKTSLPKDSIAYLKAMALESVCHSSFFCHEGCGGCDCSYLSMALQDFIKNFPQSKLVDNAAYEILKLSDQYLEEEDNSQTIKAFEEFIQKYPRADMIAEANARLLQLLFLDENRNEEALKKKINTFISSYPQHEFISEAQLMLKMMDED